MHFIWLQSNFFFPHFLSAATFDHLHWSDMVRLSRYLSTWLHIWPHGLLPASWTVASCVTQKDELLEKLTKLRFVNNIARGRFFQKHNVVGVNGSRCVFVFLHRLPSNSVLTQQSVLQWYEITEPCWRWSSALFCGKIRDTWTHAGTISSRFPHALRRREWDICPTDFCCSLQNPPFICSLSLSWVHLKNINSWFMEMSVLQNYRKELLIVTSLLKLLTQLHLGLIWCHCICHFNLMIFPLHFWIIPTVCFFPSGL